MPFSVQKKGKGIVSTVYFLQCFKLSKNRQNVALRLDCINLSKELPSHHYKITKIFKKVWYVILMCN